MIVDGLAGIKPEARFFVLDTGVLLHDQGFASIGCTHCTVAGAGRDGRWAGSDRLECGLHGPTRS